MEDLVSTNDTRGTTIAENSVATGGGLAPKVPLLVQQKGAEIGLRTTILPNLQSTVAYFLASNSELVFDGDTGDTVPNPLLTLGARDQQLLHAVPVVNDKR